MRSSTPRDFSGVCPRCFLKLELCLCTQLSRISSRIQIVIVRHVAEEWLTSNTGRLAALMLDNVRVVPYGGGNPFNDELLRDEGSWLLFPDAKSAAACAEPKRLVLLDATFRQARRMYKKIPSLRHLKQCSLSVPVARTPSLRRPTRADGMSTIEAIALALAQFESPALATPLLAAYTEFVRRADLSRGRKREPKSSTLSIG